MENNVGNADNMTGREQVTIKSLIGGIICLAVAFVMTLVDRLPLFGGEIPEERLSVTELLITVNAAPAAYIWRAVISVLLCVAASLIIRYILHLIKVKKSRVDTILSMIFSAVGYVFVIVGFILILVSFNVDVVGIGATIGILTIVLGFGAQELIADVFAGMCLMLENQFNKGDYIVADDFRGEVDNIGFRTTSIVDIGGNKKIFNNSDLRNIINCSAKPSRAVCDVGIGYGSDIDFVESVVNETIDKLKGENPDIFDSIEFWGIESLSDYAIIIRVVGETIEDDVYKARRLINKALLKAFKANNIIIPTVDVQDHNGDE